jgi:chromosome segregation ATPase
MASAEPPTNMDVQPEHPEAGLPPKTPEPHEALLQSLQAELDETVKKRQRIDVAQALTLGNFRHVAKAESYEQRIEKLKWQISCIPKTADLVDLKQKAAAEKEADTIKITALNRMLVAEQEARLADTKDVQQRLVAERKASQNFNARAEWLEERVRILTETLQSKTGEAENHEDNARLLGKANQELRRAIQEVGKANQELGNAKEELGKANQVMQTKIQEQQAELQQQKDDLEAQKARLAEANKLAWQMECKFHEAVREEEEARYMENAPQYTRGNIQPLQAEIQRQKDELKAQKAQLAAASKLAWDMECKYREAADALASEREAAKVNYNALWGKIKELEIENAQISDKAKTVEKSLTAKVTSFEVAVIKASGKAEDLGRELEEVRQEKNLEINALKNLERDLTDEIRTLVHEKEESDLIRSELSTKIAMLEPQLAKCQFRVDSLEREKGATSVAFNFLESQLKVKVGLLESQGAELRLARGQVETLEHEKEESERIKSAMTRKVSDLEHELTVLKDVEVESLQNSEENVRLRNKLSSTELELEASHRTETELAQKVSALAPQIADLEHVRVQLIENLEREKKGSDHLRTGMARRIATFEHSLKVSERNNAKLAATVRQHGSLLIDVQGELDTTKQQKEALQEEVLNLTTLRRAHLNDCDAKFHDMEAEKAQLSDKVEDLVRQLTNTRSQNDADVAALRDRERTLAAKLTEMIAEKDQRQRVGADLAVQITKLTQQLNAQVKRSASLSGGHAKEKKALERSVDERTKEINELKEGEQTYRESISVLEKKNAMLVQRLMTGGRQSAARIGELLDVLRLREKEAETLRDELDQKKKDAEDMLTDMDWLAEEGGYKSDKIKSLEKENLDLHEKMQMLKDDWVESEEEFAESKNLEEQ